MERIAANGAEFEVEVKGTGEPLLLIHGSIMDAEAYTGLISIPSLRGYQFIRYNRRGYSGSTRHNGPFSIADQARDAAGILQSLGVERAHVAGHSFGAAVALQLALDAPSVTHSLVLLEPGLMTVPSAADLEADFGQAFEAYQAGDRARAVDLFCQGVAGPDYATRITGLPATWLDQAAADIDAGLVTEMESEQEWAFTAKEAARIKQPALAMLGADSHALFRETNELLRSSMPNAEGVVIPGCTHALQMMNPQGVADAIAGFLVRHPMPVRVG